MKSEYDLSNMKSLKNPYSKEIEYTDEPIGDVTIISDFLPSPVDLIAKPKRDIFTELMDGFDALEKQREGKLTLRTFKVESKPAPALTPQDVLNVREQLHLSRPVFARYLRTNPRTVENWEQGRAKPNAQAALLIRMVALFPDMVQRLESV